MAYCPSCGSSVEGRFCAKCGTAVAAPAAPASANPPAQPYGAAPGAPPSYPPQQSAPPPGYGTGPGAPPPPPPGYGSAPPPPGYGAQGPYAPPPPGYGAQGPYAPPPPGYAQSAGMQENVASTLCYVLGWITGIVFLVLAPYNQNRNIKFHAWQSIFFFGGCTVLSIVLGIISGVVLAASFGLWSLFRLIMLCFDLAVLVCWIYLMYKAYNNERVVLPIVGPLAEKQANT